MRVLSPDACGATRRHQRIHACAECHGARVLKRPQGTHIYTTTRELIYIRWMTILSYIYDHKGTHIYTVDDQTHAVQHGDTNAETPTGARVLKRPQGTHI